MKLLPWRKKKNEAVGDAEGKEAAAAGTVVIMHDKFGQPMPQNFEALSRLGYKANETVFACVHKRSAAFAESPAVVRDEEGNHQPAHPLQRLLKRPNEYMDERELFDLYNIHMAVAGNVFWEIVRNAFGVPVEIWPLRPDRVKIVSSKEQFIHHYVYTIGEKDIPIPKEDVIHFKEPNPLDEYFGMPRLVPATQSVDLDTESGKFTLDTFRNKGIAPGIVVKSEAALTEEDAERLKEQWSQKYGDMKRGTPAFLQKGMEVHELGLTMDQLALADMRDIAEAKVCQVFDTPPIVVGAHVGITNSTYSNYEQARRAFWEDAIHPEQNRILSKLNAELVPEFEGRGRKPIYLEFDLENVAAMQEIRNRKWERVNKAVAAGWLMVNEAREAVGYNPVEGGDVFKQSSQSSSSDSPGDDEGGANAQAPSENGEE